VKKGTRRAGLFLYFVPSKSKKREPTNTRISEIIRKEWQNRNPLWRGKKKIEVEPLDHFPL